MYRYNIQKHDINSLTEFVLESYKNSRVEIVPPPKSAMDDMGLIVMDLVRESPILIASVLIIILALAASMILSARDRKKPKSDTKKTKKKK